MSSERRQQRPLAAPAVNPDFLKELDQLVGLASSGQKTDSQYFNPPNDWLCGHISVLQDLPEAERAKILAEASQLDKEAEEANAAGRAATRAWPEVVVRMDSGGLAWTRFIRLKIRFPLSGVGVRIPSWAPVILYPDSCGLFTKVFTSSS